MERLTGRVAVVTGAASGIGRALATTLANECMKVVMADVEPGALAAAARELAGRGAEVLAVETDVTRQDQVDALARRALDAFGAVHVVCNNAGVFAGGLSWSQPLEDYRWVLGVNMWGVIHGIRRDPHRPRRAQPAGRAPPPGRRRGPPTSSSSTAPSAPPSPAASRQT